MAVIELEDARMRELEPIITFEGIELLERGKEGSILILGRN